MLEIRLLGALSVHLEGRRVAPFATRVARALFGFLVLNRGRHFPRLVLAENFWSEVDEPTARKRLRMELWRIRKAFDEAGAEDDALPLVTLGDEVAFLPGEEVWIDLEELERCLARFRAAGGPLAGDQVEALESAARLYRGDLLEGEYGDWCSLPREQLRERFLECQRHLLHHFQGRGEWSPAIDVGLRMLEVDGLAEDVYRDLMSCYWAVGNRAAALQTFGLCSDRLWRELKVEPMDETVALYRRMRGDRGAPDGAPAAFAGDGPAPPSAGRSRLSRTGALSSPEVERALDDLATLEDLLDEARQRVALAVERLIQEDLRRKDVRS